MLDFARPRGPRVAVAGALLSLAAGVHVAHAQLSDEGVGRSSSAYAYGGFGVLGYIRIEGQDGLPAVLDLSTTGRLGLDFPLLRDFAIGAELRGVIIRGFPGYDTYIGDLSFVSRWQLPLAGGWVRLDIAGVLGPSAAMLWVPHSVGVMSGAAVTEHGMLGFHGGGVIGFVARIAEELSLRMQLGYVHQVLFAPRFADPATEFEIELDPTLHVDQVFFDTELIFRI